MDTQLCKYYSSLHSSQLWKSLKSQTFLNWWIPGGGQPLIRTIRCFECQSAQLWDCIGPTSRPWIHLDSSFKWTSSSRKEWKLVWISTVSQQCACPVCFTTISVVNTDHIIYTASLRCSTEYSCALQCDILVHGRLYLSKNYACFYANILTWEKSVRFLINPRWWWNRIWSGNSTEIHWKLLSTCHLFQDLTQHVLTNKMY